MKKYKMFPFGAGYEKKEVEGKEYINCFVSKLEKKQDGKYEAKFLNFNGGDLSKMIAVLQKLQMELVEEDVYQKKEAVKEVVEKEDDFSDIPF